MKPLLDALVMVIILAIVVQGLLGLIAPYAPFIVIGAGVYIIAAAAYRRWRNW